MAAILACGGGASAGSKTAAAAGGIGASGTPWKEKTREQRMDWMGIEVFPKMKAIFMEFDGEGYADFQCQTCHGTEMETVDFKMPSSIYALSTTDPIGEAREYDAEVTAFMTDVLVPEMAKLLDTTPYDPETKTGFGCFDCHPGAD